MKNVRFYAFLVCIFFIKSSLGASLLQQQSFPKTADDLTFIQTIELKQEGYEPWESEYDANGRCISGCLYPGITIQEEFDIARQHTEEAWVRAQQYMQMQQPTQYLPQQQPVKQEKTDTLSDATVNKIVDVINKTQQPRCSPSNSDISFGQKLPFGLPLTGSPRITSSFGGRIHPVTGKPSGHKGIDFSAVVGTNVFSPADGTVESVWTDSTCGNGLKISHANGYETLYCHLNKVLVKEGESVDAGCKVAETGNTGRTTGPHLHYAIKENGNFINPANWIYAQY